MAKRWAEPIDEHETLGEVSKGIEGFAQRVAAGGQQNGSCRGETARPSFIFTQPRIAIPIKTIVVR